MTRCDLTLKVRLRDMMIAHYITDQHLSQLADQHYTTIDQFISLPELLTIADYLTIQKSTFKKAGVGTAHHYAVDKQVRGDYIRWIDPSDTPECLSPIMERMKQLMDYFNETCFLGLKDIEAHLTYYPVGTRYARHLDQLQLNDSRKITFIIYLNHEWKAADGGELIVYTQEDPSSIAPIGGRLVMFRSNILEHEVIQTQKERCSITGWFLDQPAGLTFLHQK